MNIVVRRALLGALALGAGWYAVEAGEYGTSDLLRQRARRRALEAELAGLRRQVDSLAALERRLASDPVLQERVAREEFGMVRGERELLYRFADPRPSPATIDGARASSGAPLAAGADAASRGG